MVPLQQQDSPTAMAGVPWDDGMMKVDAANAPLTYCDLQGFDRLGRCWRPVLSQQKYRRKVPARFREDTEVQPVTDDVGRLQVTSELQSRVVVAPMFCAHIAPIAADVSANVGQRVE